MATISRFMISLIICFRACGVFAADASDRFPNIVIILADDLAWADVGCYGSTFHETPNLDRLAAQGMRFTNGYAAHMSCSPSRAALLTGRYPARLKITAFIPGPTLSGKYLPATMRMELPFEEVTLPEVLKESGYTTLFIRCGDWKLIEWLEDRSVDLFNLAEDPGEQQDLAAAMPERVAEMREQLHQWRKDVDANMPRARSRIEEPKSENSR